MPAGRRSKLEVDSGDETGRVMAENGVRSKPGSAAVFENFSSGATRTFRWTPEAVRHLYEDVQWAQKSNPTGAAEVAGVLLGKGDSSDEIVDCHPVLLMQEQDHAYALGGPGRRGFERAIMAVRSSAENERSVIGLYRSQIGQGLDVTEEDLGLIRTCFRDSSPVVVLIRVAANGSSSVRLFSGEEGQLVSEFDASANHSGLPAWLDLWQNLSGEDPEERVEPEDATEITERTEVTPASEGVPAVRLGNTPIGRPAGVAENPVRIERPVPRRPASLVALATILLVGIGLLIFKAPAALKHANGSGAAAAHQLQAGGSYPGLPLRVEKQGDDIRLDWDRTAPVLGAATGGMLTIREGDAPEKQVLLDLNLLRTGAVMYRPVHGGIVLRLVIFGPNGRKIAESVARYPQRISASGDHPDKGE
jgi:hypothetical protein